MYLHMYVSGFFLESWAIYIFTSYVHLWPHVIYTYVASYILFCICTSSMYVTPLIIYYSSMHMHTYSTKLRRLDFTWYTNKNSTRSMFHQLPS